MIISLIDRVFDEEVFNTFPRCRYSFGASDHGCHITAFLKAMGISIICKEGKNIVWSDGKFYCDLSTIILAIEDLATKVLGSKIYSHYYPNNKDTTPNFTTAVMTSYDERYDDYSMSLIRELIDKLPNKVNHNRTIKDFVSNGWTQEGDENSLVFTRKPKCLAGKQ